MRRTPNERARHSKRLGHVLSPGLAHHILAGSGNEEDVKTTSSMTKALTIEPITPSSVSGQQTTSSPVQPVTQATSTPHVSSSPSSSMTPTDSATKIPSMSTATSTSPYFNSMVTGTSTSLPPSTSPLQTTIPPPASGLSGGSIAGITIASVIVGVALIAFCVRKVYLRRRDLQRASLSGQYAFEGAESRRESKIPSRSPGTKENPAGSRDDTQRASSISPFDARGQSVYLTSSGILSPTGSQPSTPISHVSYVAPAPPPASYNNPGNIAALPTARVAAGPGTDVNTTGPPIGIQPVATIKCSFVPTLPDELSISTGERVRVINRFDDGWALCENGGGEQGMVPQDCLEQITIDPDDADWRNARRVSSLNPDAWRS